MSKLDSYFSDKRELFFYLLIGTGILTFLEIYLGITNKAYHDLINILILLITTLLAFVISYLLILMYGYLYKKNHPLWHIFIILFFISAIAFFIWFVSHELLCILLSPEYGHFLLIDEGSISIDFSQLIAESIFLTIPSLLWGVSFVLTRSRKDYNLEKAKAVNAQLLAKDAQLMALRYQINPHFLFNTLISVQALMYHNTDLADKMLTEFSEFLRYTLRYNQSVFVPLKKEIEILEKYLLIEKIRFGEQLNYKFEISEKTEDIEVLCFMLQPLVENAIKHGMGSSHDISYIIVSSDLINSWLNLEVKNTGKFKSNGYKSGTGLINIKERLENAYPSAHSFQILNEDDWVRIIIKIHI